MSSSSLEDEVLVCKFKSELLDMLFSVTDKSLLQSKLMEFLVNKMNAEVAGILADVGVEWDTCFSFPSLEAFWKRFRFFSAYPKQSLLLQACIEVQLEEHSEVSFVFVPLSIHTPSSIETQSYCLAFGIPSSQRRENICILLQPSLRILTESFKTYLLETENAEMRKHLERLQKEHKELHPSKRVKSTTNNSQNIVMCTNNNGTLTYVSERAQKLIGVSREILGNTNIMDLMLPSNNIELVFGDSYGKETLNTDADDINTWKFMSKNGGIVELNLRLERHSNGFILTGTLLS